MRGVRRIIATALRGPYAHAARAVRRTRRPPARPAREQALVQVTQEAISRDTDHVRKLQQQQAHPPRGTLRSERCAQGATASRGGGDVLSGADDVDGGGRDAPGVPGAESSAGAPAERRRDSRDGAWPRDPRVRPAACQAAAVVCAESDAGGCNADATPSTPPRTAELAASPADDAPADGDAHRAMTGPDTAAAVGAPPTGEGDHPGGSTDDGEGL